MISGYFGSVTAREVRGWAYDSADPGAHVVVEIVCGERIVGRTRADLYRRDLEAAGIGAGDHAFLFDCVPPLSEADLPAVAARVPRPGASPLELKRVAPQPDRQPAQPPITWRGPTTDPEHRPVFILGSARSGTSAITEALLASTGYEGYSEGHFFDVLAPLGVALRAYNVTKGEERARKTAAARFAPSFVEDGLASIAIDAARQLFPLGLWLDKTPYTNMIHLAPRFRQIWPNARFIFMKRRGVDNVLSRLRKWDGDFPRHCRDWAGAMQAWLSVRDGLRGASLELDQLTLAHEPERGASEVATLLGLSDVEQARMAQALARERPQRTGENVGETVALKDTGWSAEWMLMFREMCGPMMAAFAYGE